MNEKLGLHPRNKHKSAYDFKELIKEHPALSTFVTKNKFNNESIDFSNATAVKALNTALLKHFYKVRFWDVPPNYLCPPIPGRADYIHFVADLLTPENGKIPTGEKIHMLDIGVGANCVYPLIAHQEYGWSVVGSDADTTAVKNANLIVSENHLENFINIRHQENKNKFFENVIKEGEFFHVTVCNPPFNSSAEEARLNSEKKNRNLGLKRGNSNFQGQNNELWYEGGEEAFIIKMIQESVAYQKNCLWFSTLVSKITTLPMVYDELKKRNVAKFRTIDMAQGQKKSRVVAWTFTH
jgi:23S rRNA (adenine1618-N6)-methyltransferase